MREKGPSAVWGGATGGLVVGLILGFFVGSSYWKTVLFAVLIGAGVGLASNLLAGAANVIAWRSQSRDRRAATSEREAEITEAEIIELMKEGFSPDDLEREERAEDVMAMLERVSLESGTPLDELAEEVLRDREKISDEDAHTLAEALAVTWREQADEPDFIPPPPSLLELVEQAIGEPVWAEDEG